MDRTRIHRRLLVCAVAAALACLAPTADAQLCNFGTVQEIPELEFWGPHVLDLRVREGVTHFAAGSAPGTASDSPFVNYTAFYPGSTAQPMRLVLFLHGGFPDAARSYCELLLHLASHGYFVVFVQRNPTTPTPAAYAAQALSVVDHFASGGDPAIPASRIAAPATAGNWTVLGHSWGGATSFFVAADPRFTRVIAMQPMEGAATFGDSTLTDAAVPILRAYQGELFVIAGERDHVTPSRLSADWWAHGIATSRRVMWEVEGMSHYGPMSLNLQLGGFDPVYPGNILPDLIDFQTQLRLHKRIVTGALLSRESSSRRLMRHLFGASIAQQTDVAGTPAPIGMKIELTEPLAWAVSGAADASATVYGSEDDLVLFQFALGPNAPWQPVLDGEMNVPLGMDLTRSTAVKRLPGIRFRCVVRRPSGTVITDPFLL